MASNQCIIDDAYCVAMGNYFKRQGERIDQMIRNYKLVLETVGAFAIADGEVHDVLINYIDYVSKMIDKIDAISNNAQSQITTFISKVDEADQYLF